MNERRAEGAGTSRQLAAFLPVLSLGALLGGAWLVRGGEQDGLSAGILLMIAGLAAAGVALGAGRWGPEPEGSLDLSARIGLGFLGGLLGAVATAALSWLLFSTGVHGSFGIAMGPLAIGGADHHVLTGAIWGALLGVLLPFVPGAGPTSRGAMFSILPSLYVLLKVMPFDWDSGAFGVELGALTFLFVFLYNLVWGLVAGRSLAWGLQTELAPVSRPLGEVGLDE